MTPIATFGPLVLLILCAWVVINPIKRVCDCERPVGGDEQ